MKIPETKGLIKDWMGIPLKSGLVFWVGGLLAWIDYAGGLDVFSRTISTMKEETFAAYAILFIFLMAVGVSIVKRIDEPVLRIMEGYHWPVLKKFMKKRFEKKWEKEEPRLQYLYSKNFEGIITKEETEELVDLEARLKFLPEKKEHQLPTMLGNILRTYELIPREKYGLNAFVCWPRLWFVLPKEIREEISHVREELDTTAQVFTWGFLFLFWAVFAWWAIPAGLLLMLLSYRWALRAADIYGKLIVSAFDLYRYDLYEKLRFKIPETPEEERKTGEAVSRFLKLGTDS